MISKIDLAPNPGKADNASDYSIDSHSAIPGLRAALLSRQLQSLAQECRPVRRDSPHAELQHPPRFWLFIDSPNAEVQTGRSNSADQAGVQCSLAAIRSRPVNSWRTASARRSSASGYQTPDCGSWRNSTTRYVGDFGSTRRTATSTSAGKTNRHDPFLRPSAGSNDPRQFGGDFRAALDLDVKSAGRRSGDRQHFFKRGDPLARPSWPFPTSDVELP